MEVTPLRHAGERSSAQGRNVCREQSILRADRENWHGRVGDGRGKAAEREFADIRRHQQTFADMWVQQQHTGPFTLAEKMAG